MDLMEIYKIVAMSLALIIAIVGHEIMHGFIAYKYGDDTAKMQGRLSINPIKHVDLFGTIILPFILFVTNAGFLFGWAKPVPVYMPTILRNGGNLGAINVALAGIVYNFSLAIFCTIMLHFFENIHVFLTLFLFFMVQINIVLGFFNLLPIPPLDGFNALNFLLFELKLNNIANTLLRFERYGFIVLIVIIATPISNYIFAPINKIILYLLN